MLIGDLNQRALKLEREQKARLEQERRKAEREKLAEGRQKARRQRELDEAARRRAAASAEAELVPHQLPGAQWAAAHYTCSQTFNSMKFDSKQRLRLPVEPTATR